MRINFERRVNTSVLLTNNIGVEPTYGKGTMRGVAWCPCGKCVGNMILVEKDKVVGWIDTECSCGNQIDWSEADKYI